MKWYKLDDGSIITIGPILQKDLINKPNKLWTHVPTRKIQIYEFNLFDPDSHNEWIEMNTDP